MSESILHSVRKYRNVYLRLFGNYSLLYYPCAFVGIFMFISLSFMFNSFNFRFSAISSTGTIVIMALHGIVFLYVITILKYLGSLDYVLLTFIGKLLSPSLSFMLLYYPIIWFQKHLPIVIGGRGSLKKIDMRI